MREKEKIQRFLAGSHLADLVTLMPEGAPHVAPVWYTFDGDSYVVLAEPTTVKVRNIRNDPRVAISIAKHDSPYAYVAVQGTATISEGKTGSLLLAMSRRYLGETRGKEYAENMQKEACFVFITVTPEKTISYFE